MKISIITPVYNEPRIQYTLESILSQQDVPGLEVIVVDGNSTDETKNIINDYSEQIDVLLQEPDEGVYDAMNKGIQQASGDVIGILNADDRYADTDILRSVLNEFETSGADLCYGDLVYVNDDDNVVRYWESGQYHPRRFWYGWMPPHPTVFIKKEIYDKYNWFDLDFPIAADYELLLRYLVCHNISASYLNKVLVRMALGGQSNESIYNIIKSNSEVYKAWKKNGLSGGIHVPILKPARKISQYFRSYDD